MNYSNQGQQAGYGNQLGVPSAPQAPGILGSIEQALEQALSRIHSHQADLRGIADRVLGTEPEAVSGKDGATQSNPPQLRRIADLADYLLTATEVMGNQVTRLHRL